MNRLRVAWSCTGMATLAWAATAAAHHGTAGNYDQTTLIKIVGVVKEFNWRNPHSALFIEGKDDSGVEATYILELGAPKALVDRGFTRTTFKPGDQVTVQMHPSFTHPENGEMAEERFWVNGKEVHASASKQ